MTELAAESVGYGRRGSVLGRGEGAAWEAGEEVSRKLEHQLPLLWKVEKKKQEIMIFGSHKKNWGI